MFSDYASLLELAITQDIKRRFGATFFEPGQASQNSECLVLVDDFSSGGAIIDQAMRIVIGGWSDAVEKDRPTVSKATADGELDFWKKFDESEINFVKIFLDMPLKFMRKIQLSAYSNPIFKTYADLIRKARFSHVETEDRPEIKALKALLYESDDIGGLSESAGYALYKTLLNTYHDAQLTLEDPNLKLGSLKYKRAQSRLEQAQTELNIRGQKNVYEEAERALLKYEKDRSLADERQSLINRYEASEWDSIAEPGMKYPHTALQNPGLFNVDLNSGGWIKVSLDRQQLKGEEYGQLATLLGRDTQELRSARDNVERIEFYYQCFGINRAWMDWSFWSQEYWQSDSLISDGRGGGLLPALASKIIVVPAFRVFEPKADMTFNFTGQHKPVAMQRSVMRPTPVQKTDPQFDAFEALARKKGIKVKKMKYKALKPVLQQASQSVVSTNMHIAPQIIKQAQQRKQQAVVPTQAPQSRQSRKNTQKQVAAQAVLIASGVLFNWAKNRGKRKAKTLSLVYDLRSDQMRKDIELKLENVQTRAEIPILSADIGAQSSGTHESKLPYGVYNLVVCHEGRELSRTNFNFQRDSSERAHISIHINSTPVHSSSRNPDAEDFDLIRVFGYLAKAIPASPATFSR